MLKYLKLDENKKPLESFDTTYTSLDNLQNAGIKLTNTTVIVDFDIHDEKETEKINTIVNYIFSKYPTFKVKTTRGYHLYYKAPTDSAIKNWVNMMTVAGVKVDYKSGNTSQGVIKVNDIVRETSYPLENLNFSKLPTLPIELYPLSRAKNNILMGLKNGDGRNTELFKHLSIVKDAKLKIDLNYVADFINNYVFDDTLNNSEISRIVESVTNRESVHDGVYHGDIKDMIEFAKFIAQELDVKIYNYNLYFKNGLNYNKNMIKLNKAISKHLALKHRQYAEIEKQLFIYAELIEDNKNFNVKLRNGVIVEDQVVNYDCGFTPYFLDVTYEPSAYDKNVDDFLNFVTNGNDDMRTVLEEILGHILLINRFPHKLFFLTGSGANGKSTFVEMITKWVGELASHIDISNFDDGTSLVSLAGKLVNVADDVDAIYLEKSKNLKTMASGNTIGCRAIYSQPIELKNTATLIFTANEPPVFKDKSDGISRRLLIIPFTNKVKKRIFNLDELLSSDNAKSYLLNLALQGIKRIYENNLELSSSVTIKNATEQYYIDNDSVLGYVTDYPNIENNSIGTVYDAYMEYCEDSNLKAVSKNKFSRRLKMLGYEVKIIKMLGKTTRVIVKE